MDEIQRRIDDTIIYHFLNVAFGKSYAIAQKCKSNRKHAVMVKDRGSMDNWVRLGVPPSQIIVLSEQNAIQRNEIKIDGCNWLEASGRHEGNNQGLVWQEDS